jgi:hypothetical protein
MDAAVSRMPGVQKGREFKLKEFLGLPGVRGETHWGKQMKEHPLLKLHLRWEQCCCSKCLADN